eukprot:2565920-Rhodomonas_salina.1
MLPAFHPALFPTRLFFLLPSSPQFLSHPPPSLPPFPVGGRRRLFRGLGQDKDPRGGAGRSLAPCAMRHAVCCMRSILLTVCYDAAYGGTRQTSSGARQL